MLAPSIGCPSIQVCSSLSKDIPGPPQDVRIRLNRVHLNEGGGFAADPPVFMEHRQMKAF